MWVAKHLLAEPRRALHFKLPVRLQALLFPTREVAGKPCLVRNQVHLSSRWSMLRGPVGSNEGCDCSGSPVNTYYH